MTSAQQHSLAAALGDLRIAHPDHDLNPWKDDHDKSTTPPPHEPRDSLGLEPSYPAKEVLSEFDPLASPEEQAAREAWQTSEGHPPPPPVVPPSSEESPSDPASASTSALLPSRSLSPFPSLASLAKTFSLPNLTRPRPASMDATQPVHPPSNLSTVVTGQSEPPTEEEYESSHEPQPTSAGQHEMDVEIQFDFQRFLDQMKSRSAEPVSRFLRSFLGNFAKRAFVVTDQVRIIGDFLNFIAGHMRDCEVWRNATEAEFDNALEGMEKLVMNRLYEFTFTPQVARTTPPRPFNPDDLERDRVLGQRIYLFGWVEEMHLDVPVGEGSEGFVNFAEQELLKMNHYKAPRDKLICILNCCKVIFGLIRHLKRDEGADSFVPILIYVVLKANPPHLLSNVEFINRFRNPAKLQGEAGYYLSSLIGAISFIETMDHTSLSNITREEFESNVEAAIQALSGSEPQSPIVAHQNQTPDYVQFEQQLPPSPHAGEESAQPLSMSTSTSSINFGEDARKLLQKTGDAVSKPLSAIGRIFSEAFDGAENKLSNLPVPFAPFEPGREHAEGQHPQEEPKTPAPAGSSATPYGAPIQTPYKARVRKIPQPPSPGSPFSPGGSMDGTPSRGPRQWRGPMTNQPLALGPSQPVTPFHPPRHPPPPHGYPEHYMHNQQPRMPPRVQSLAASEGGLGFGDGTSDPSSHISRTPTPSLDFSGVQAEIDVAHANAATAARETLVQIFPGTDAEVIEWVLEANGGDLGKSIEALLEMNNGG